MKNTFGLILLSLITTVVFGQSKESQVWQKVDALTRAVFETKDSVAITSLVSKGLTYGHSDGRLEDMGTMVHNAVANKGTYKNVSVERQSITLANNTAIVRHILRASSIDSAGTQSPLNLGILLVWTIENGQWRLIARQAVKVAPKQ